MINRIKEDNKKAFGPFIKKIVLWVSVGLICGFTLGAVSNMLDAASVTLFIKQGFIDSAIYLMPLSWIIFSIPSFICLRKANKLINNWDNEDETIPDKAEYNISTAILLNDICYKLDLLIFGCAFILCMKNSNTIYFSIMLLISIAIMTALQTMAVNETRRLYPEKACSALDTKFLKKWEESCDEAELMEIGKASYKAFKAVSFAGSLIFVLLFILSIFFDIGVLPLVTVIAMTLVSNVTYILAARKK